MQTGLGRSDLLAQCARRRGVDCPYSKLLVPYRSFVDRVLRLRAGAGMSGRDVGWLAHLVHTLHTLPLYLHAEPLPVNYSPILHLPLTSRVKNSEPMANAEYVGRTISIRQVGSFRSITLGLYLTNVTQS